MNKLDRPGILAALALAAGVSQEACSRETDTVSGDTRDRVTHVVNRGEELSAAAQYERDGDFYGAALEYNEVGNKAKAKECFEKAAAQAEQKGDFHNAAWSYRDAGNEAKAKECFEKAAAWFEQNGDFHSAAVAYDEAGNKAKAKECEGKRR